jgi:ferritin-like metal-binding protein YciE
LISAAQRVEHYEIAGYGSVRAYAELLGHSDAAKLLDATLNEEKAADKKLTQISGAVNAGGQKAA